MDIGTFAGAVNASIIFTEIPLEERFAAVKRAGFDAVELWWPFTEAVPDNRSVEDLLGAIDAADVRLVSLNLFAGDMAGGERGVLSWPGYERAVRDNVDVVVDIARRTGCRRFNALYGQRLGDVSAARQDELATENLAHVAAAVGAVGGVIVVESLTQGENGRYPLTTAADAIAVIDRVQAAGTANIGLLFDTYHLTNNGDNLTTVIDLHGDRIGHVQVADSPGRGQPGTGSIDFGAVLAGLEQGGYSGYVSCEYRPVGASEGSFEWIKGAR